MKKIFSLLLATTLISCSGTKTRRTDLTIGSRNNVITTNRQNSSTDSSSQQNSQNTEASNPQSGTSPDPSQTNEQTLTNRHMMIVTPGHNKITFINETGEEIKILHSRQDITSAAWSSESGRAVFLTQNNTERNAVLSIIDLYGNSTLQMKAKNISAPAISKKGDFICYSSFKNNEFQIHIINISSRENSVVYKTPVNGIPVVTLLDRGKPVISPNGRYIAFSAYTGKGFNIFIRDIENNITRKLTRFEGNDYSPVFSPNNKYIAYLSKREDIQIFKIRTDGRGRRRLTFHPGAKRSLCFSPNGKKIAYINQYKRVNRIYLMDINGDGLTSLRSTRSKIISCKFYTKKNIVFQTSRGVYTINTDDTQIRRLYSARYSRIFLAE